MIKSIMMKKKKKMRVLLNYDLEITIDQSKSEIDEEKKK